MNKQKHSIELSTSIVKAGHRVYFVDAKIDVEGNRFVAISEVKSSLKDKGNTRERQRIHIYEEDLPRFLDAMGEALTAIAHDRTESKVTTEAQATAYDYSLSSSQDEKTTPTSLDIPNLDDIVDLE